VHCTQLKNRNKTCTALYYVFVFALRVLLAIRQVTNGQELLSEHTQVERDVLEGKVRSMFGVDQTISSLPRWEYIMLTISLTLPLVYVSAFRRAAGIAD
jgi:hypothetical protein